MAGAAWAELLNKPRSSCMASGRVCRHGAMLGVKQATPSCRMRPSSSERGAARDKEKGFYSVSFPFPKWNEIHIVIGLFPLVLLFLGVGLGAGLPCPAVTSVGGGCQQVWPRGGHESIGNGEGTMGRRERQSAEDSSKQKCIDRRSW